MPNSYRNPLASLFNENTRGFIRNIKDKARSSTAYICDQAVQFPDVGRLDPSRPKEFT